MYIAPIAFYFYQKTPDYLNGEYVDINNSEWTDKPQYIHKTFSHGELKYGTEIICIIM